MELIPRDGAVNELIDAAEPLERWDTGFTFTEGPVYCRGLHYFTDFMVNKIFRYEGGVSTLIDGNSFFSIGMTYDRKNDRILRCARDRRAIMDLEGNVIVDNYRGTPINGSNDVIVDSGGRIYFSDPLSRKIEGLQTGHSSVFRYDEKTGEMYLFEPVKALEYPNGIALSPDEKLLYITETRGSDVYRLDIASGKMELFVHLDEKAGEGRPDGLRLDARGNLYVTGPGGIWLLDPRGKILGLVKMPETAANLCFDDRGLFITASTGIYHLNTKIPGLL
ncbi:MAG: SMP-30/gluconolactonase/LRE family protein [Spirochaetaceae bacterium]|jgi:gluconolactonase|nr:SMP-30/gluconolactonase/LRE family protein [Spirochaetaceae bacterium]